MRVFITGGSGFVGSAVVPELIKAGHKVIGLARSDASAKALAAAGAEVHQGDLENLDSLRSGIAKADGVIHLGFIHDFARFAEVCETDRKVIEAIGEALKGSDRPFVVTSGTALAGAGLEPGRVATEADRPTHGAHPRVASEQATDAAVAKGVRASVVRLAPTTHGDGDHGFVPMLIATGREKGISAYVGEGKNRWNAVHRLDAGLLYRLALEKATAGERLHAIDEEAVAFKDIAEAIGKGLGIPVVSKSAEEAAAHFGWFTAFASLDCPASSKVTQERMGWKPMHAKLIKDLEQGTYFKS